jgi:predicted nuclease with TOPRIM domain
MSDELKELQERVGKVEQKLKRTVSEAVLAHYFEPLKRDVETLERRFDELLDATIKGITTNSAEELKVLKKR